MSDLSALVVDDDPFALYLTKEFLEDLGVKDVRTARNGTEALEAVDERSPQLIVCDLNMDTMDGLELMRHLAEARFEGSILIQSGTSADILATASDLALKHGHRLLSAVAKPVGRETLSSALEELAGGTQAGDEEPESTPTGTMTDAEFARGVRSGGIELWVQPKVTVRDRRVVGAEVLLRWRCRDGNLALPEAILPRARELGLEEDITLSVVRMAGRALTAWRAQSRDLRLSINISPGGMASLSLPDALEGAVQEGGADPHDFTLELKQVESSTELALLLEVIGRLRLKGFGIAIDDFGTGYSTLLGLKSLPITELKIDRSFVTGAKGDASLGEILSSSTTLGRRLGLSVVAQGVEDAKVMELLEELGCDEVQGYLVARPMPIEDFLDWKDRWDRMWRSGRGWAR
jgi:EAL domain-containing protein (putative c-di-GMP-specific phosphodiesterase class I)/CheY-like chemotaxis protein